VFPRLAGRLFVLQLSNHTDAKASGALGDMVAALHHLKSWRLTAEKTLESGDVPFLSQERELELLFKSAGKDEEWLNPGEQVPISFGLN
jgi:hypothetical protein